jgi:hypothetical protein
LSPVALNTLALRRGAAPAQAETAAALAGGQASRLLLALASEAEVSVWDTVADLRKAAAAKRVGPIFDAAAGFADKESRQDLPEVLALLARLYRDALVSAAGAGELCLLRDRARELEILAARARTDYDLRTLRGALHQVVQTSSALLANVNPTTAIEKMLMDLMALEAGLP